MTITCTHGNSKNGIKGSRITITSDDGTVVDQFIVPSPRGKQYCEQHAGGQYGRRYHAAIEKAKTMDSSSESR